MAVNKLPSFKAIPNKPGSDAPLPHHQATVHFEESMEEIHHGKSVAFHVPGERGSLMHTFTDAGHSLHRRGQRETL